MQNHKVKLANAGYEFVIEDIDGRLIGIGLIYSNDTYFENSNYLEHNAL